MGRALRVYRQDDAEGGTAFGGCLERAARFWALH